MEENGVLNEARIKYLGTPRSDCGASDNFISMGFVNIISVFAMLLVAYMIGIGVCISELLFKYWVEKSLQILPY